MGVRAGGGAGGTRPKNFLIKTRKNEKSLKLREQPFAEEFSETGLGVGCRLVGRCPARLLLSGTKDDFVGAKDHETSHLARIFSDMGWVGGVVSSVSCRACLHLSGIQFSPPFPWNYTLVHSDCKAPEMLGKCVSGNQFFKIFWGRTP